MRDVSVGRQHRFFTGMALLLVVIVGVGFARSFYFQSYFEAKQPASAAQHYPLYLIVHGVLLSMWFLLFVGQTVLVAVRRTRLHRTIGVGGAVLAGAVFIASLLVVVRSVARSGANGIPDDRLPLVVIGNLGTLLLFALFIVGGVWFRRKPDVHKRLMLLASISMVAPAISRWPGGLSYFPASVVLPHFALFIALLVFDKLATGRVQKTSAWGVSLYFAVFAASIALGFSAVGRSLVNMLRAV